MSLSGLKSLTGFVYGIAGLAGYIAAWGDPPTWAVVPIALVSAFLGGFLEAAITDLLAVRSRR